MSLVPSRRTAKRDVSYEFMNRQMVWHTFTVSLPPLCDFPQTEIIQGISPLFTPPPLYPVCPAMDFSVGVKH